MTDMPGVHGNLKISLIGKPGALDRVEDVMSSLKTCTGPAGICQAVYPEKVSEKQGVCEYADSLFLCLNILIYQ